MTAALPSEARGQRGDGKVALLRPASDAAPVRDDPQSEVAIALACADRALSIGEVRALVDCWAPVTIKHALRGLRLRGLVEASGDGRLRRYRWIGGGPC